MDRETLTEIMKFGRDTKAWLGQEDFIGPATVVGKLLRALAAETARADREAAARRQSEQDAANITRVAQVNFDQYQIERAERDRLRAELAEAKDSAHYANGVAELAMKHRDAAEAELARLRDQLDMVWEQLAGEDI